MVCVSFLCIFNTLFVNLLCVFLHLWCVCVLCELRMVCASFLVVSITVSINLACVALRLLCVICVCVICVRFAFQFCLCFSKRFYELAVRVCIFRGVFSLPFL